MKQIILQYDKSLTASPLGYSLTCDAINVVCDVIPESGTTFTTAGDTKYVSVVGRYQLAITLSLVNFESDDSQYVKLRDFTSAPIKRINYVGEGSTTAINGYSAFTGNNSINLFLDSSNINYASNKKYRNVSLVLFSENTYTF